MNNYKIIKIIELKIIKQVTQKFENLKKGLFSCISKFQKLIFE